MFGLARESQRYHVWKPSAAVRCFGPMARILLATSDRSASRGGEQFVHLAAHLAAGGHNVVLVLPAQHDAGPVTTLRWPSKTANTLRDGAFMWKTLRSFRPDRVVGRRGGLNWTIVLSRLVGVRERVVWDDTMRDQWLVDYGSGVRVRFLIWRRRMVYRASTRIVAVSRAAADGLTSSYGLDPRRCRVVLNGVPDIGSRDERGVDHVVRFVAIARLEPSKGHLVFIRALAAMDPDVRERVSVRIFGDGPFRERIAEEIERFDLRTVVEIVGNVPEHEVVAALHASDVFVHPSLIDNCPFSLLEAMSARLAIVATRVGGVPEVVENEHEGVLVPPGDPQAFARALEAVTVKRVSRRELGRRARERFEAEFTIGHWTERAAAVVLE